MRDFLFALALLFQFHSPVFDTQLSDPVNLAIQLCSIGTLNAYSVQITYPVPPATGPPNWSIAWWVRSGEGVPGNEWPGNLKTAPCTAPPTCDPAFGGCPVGTCDPGFNVGMQVDPGWPCVLTVWNKPVQ